MDKRSPPTSISRLRFLYSSPYVACVQYFWFSPCSEGFSLGSSGFPLQTNHACLPFPDKPCLRTRANRPESYSDVKRPDQGSGSNPGMPDGVAVLLSAASAQSDVLL